MALPLNPVRTVDYHTAGEPFRIVVQGAPHTQGATVLERRLSAMTGEADVVRALLCNEPRGHADMYGCFLVPPNDDGAVLGALFWHKDGFSTACGHGSIALAVYAVDSGLVVAPHDGETQFNIDVPSGRVGLTVRRNAGRTTSVAFANVASFVIARAVPIVTSIGTIAVDVSYGGAIYASARASDLDLRVEPGMLAQMITIGREIKAQLSSRPESQHPTDERLSGIYGTIWFDDVSSLDEPGGGVRQRNCTVFADGEVDRSPCGSGTSARLALLHSQNRLAVGEGLHHSSVIGSVFRGRVLGYADEPVGAVLTEVEGMAFRTGEHTFLLDPADTLGLGFQLR